MLLVATCAGGRHPRRAPLPSALPDRVIAAADGARLEILPGVGHWPMLEAPARAAELLREHLAASPG